MWEATLPLFNIKAGASKGGREKGVLAVLGPGVMACLADSDVGGLLTMAVSGSRCGFAFLPLQILLIAPLYMAQELTVRLSACSHRSLSGLAFDHLGRFWGIVTFLSCLGVGCSAIVSEFTGVAAVGELWGISRATSCCLSAILLGAIALKGDYSIVEKAGLLLGGCACVFLFLGLFCRPSIGEVEAAVSLQTSLVVRPEFRKIVAANIGTVITPWILFYQLSANVEKRLVIADLALARLDTAAGALATQLVMASVLVTFARLAPGAELEHMPLQEALVQPLRPWLGDFWAKVLMSCGLLGASMLASLVASLAIGWNCADTLGTRGTSSFTWRLGVLLSVAFGALLIGCNLASIVHLNLTIQVMNGISMPLVVGILFLLARSDALPPALRLHGCYGIVCGIVFATCSIITLLCTFI